MKCSVIQDLLPSYVDEICSQDTRELVQEHVAECEQCRNKLEQMKHTEIVAVEAPERQIDYLKKIRSTITRKEWLGKFMLIALATIELIGFTGVFSNSVGPIIYFTEGISVHFSILLLCVAALAGNFEFSRTKKAAAVETVISGAGFLLLLALHEYAIQSAGHGEIPFFVPQMSDVGPFLVTCYRMILCIEMLVLLRNTFGKQKNAYATAVNIISISLAVFFKASLYNMETVETYMNSVHVGEVLQVVLLAAVVTVYTLMRKYGKIS